MMETISAYPLQWPLGFTRTFFRKTSAFATTFGAARDGLRKELRMMKADGVIISTNIPIKRNGDPYAQPGKIDDPGVAVYFMLYGEQHVLACDKWIDITSNLRALEKTVEAMRGIERWGASDMLKRSFTGFKALPPAKAEHTWFEVLNVPPTASRNEIMSSFRDLIKECHPDTPTYDEQQYARLLKAKEQGLGIQSLV